MARVCVLSGSRGAGALQEAMCCCDVKGLLAWMIQCVVVSRGFLESAVCGGRRSVARQGTPLIFLIMYVVGVCVLEALTISLDLRQD